MKGIAKHSAEYINEIGLKRWHTLELEFDQSTKHPLEALAEVETLVQQAVVKSCSQVIPDNSITPSQPSIIKIERTSEDTRIAELIRDIYACTELDGPNGLWTYKTLSETCTEAKSAYEVMGNKLRKKESQELIASSRQFDEKVERELRLKGKLNDK